MNKMSKECKLDRDAKVAAYQKAKTALESALEAMTDAIGDLEAWRDDLRNEVQDHFEDRSEKWQESPAGEQVQAWIDALDDVQFDAPELDLEDLAEIVNSLPESSADC